MENNEDDFQEPEETEYCDACGAEIIPYENDFTECSLCGDWGCERCLPSCCE